MKNNLLSYLIETLNLLLIPGKEIDIPYISSIQSNLEELESDNYTFLHQDNLEELLQAGHITKDCVDTLLTLRKRIERIDESLWNPTSFINSNEWNEIRQAVLNIYIDHLS